MEKLGSGEKEIGARSHRFICAAGKRHSGLTCMNLGKPLPPALVRCFKIAIIHVTTDSIGNIYGHTTYG
jgi:hypothetical protein